MLFSESCYPACFAYAVASTSGTASLLSQAAAIRSRSMACQPAGTATATGWANLVLSDSTKLRQQQCCCWSYSSTFLSARFADSAMAVANSSIPAWASPLYEDFKGPKAAPAAATAHDGWQQLS